MPLDDQLNFTMPHSINTIQFQSENLNAFVSSILTALILANFGSIIHKIIEASPAQIFRYSSWLRALIFSASDDTLRLFYWIRGKSDYNCPDKNHESPSPRRRRFSRLLLPITARAAIVFASTAMIALAFPRTTEYPICNHGDYALEWGPLDTNHLRPLPAALCPEIPITTNIGRVLTSAEFCILPSFDNNFLSLPDTTQADTTQVRVSYNDTIGWVNHGFSSGTFNILQSSFVQWHRAGVTSHSFHSDFSTLDMQTMLNLTVRAIQDVAQEDCPQLITNVLEINETSIFFSVLGCCLHIDRDPIRAVEYMNRVNTYLLSATRWVKRGPQRRIRVSTDFQYSNECPVWTSVTRPILSPVPLAIFTLAMFATNMLVSFLLRKQGNITDAANQIVVEALGLDLTGNPLHGNGGEEEIMEWHARKWMGSSTGKSHYGFLGGRGDVPVDKLDGGDVVVPCWMAAAANPLGKVVVA